MGVISGVLALDRVFPGYVGVFRGVWHYVGVI